ncbi:hypothetical protein SUGI_0260070 [Cryptomeria japonica]|nr:hypothetical protein SUGI_0260070 [Cryptomeria japonica]
MVHRFGLSCLCREETLEVQCDRLFDIDTGGLEAICGIVEGALSDDRHWEVDADAVGSAVMEVEEEWPSILGPFFNTAVYLSDVECLDSEDEEQVAEVALKAKEEEFMNNAWEVFCVGVKNDDQDPFKRMMWIEEGWLSEGSIDRVALIGTQVATILRLL